MVPLFHILEMQRRPKLWPARELAIPQRLLNFSRSYTPPVLACAVLYGQPAVVGCTISPAFAEHRFCAGDTSGVTFDLTNTGSAPLRRLLVCLRESAMGLRDLHRSVGDALRACRDRVLATSLSQRFAPGAVRGGYVPLYRDMTPTVGSGRLDDDDEASSPGAGASGEPDAESMEMGGSNARSVSVGHGEEGAAAPVRFGDVFEQPVLFDTTVDGLLNGAIVRLRSIGGTVELPPAFDLAPGETRRVTLYVSLDGHVSDGADDRASSTTPHFSEHLSIVSLTQGRLGHVPDVASFELRGFVDDINLSEAGVEAVAQLPDMGEFKSLEDVMAGRIDRWHDTEDLVPVLARVARVLPVDLTELLLPIEPLSVNRQYRIADAETRVEQILYRPPPLPKSDTSRGRSYASAR